MKPDITILKPNPTITEMFQYCNAPLKNTRWSWGAVSENNDIFLRGSKFLIFKFVNIVYNSVYKIG